MMDRTEAESTDGRLIAAARGGDERAFAKLVERHFPLVFQIAYARLGEREGAEDAAQEIFLRVYLRIDRYDPARPFAPWLAAVARNFARDWSRRTKRRTRLAPMIPMHDLPSEPTDPRTKGARREMEEKERNELVREAIFRLPARLREIVLLHYAEDMNKAEIARRLDIHASTVGRRMTRALVRLKRTLSPVVHESEAIAKAASPLRTSKKAVARTTALIGAVAAMSPGAKAALAAGATGAGLGGLSDLVSMQLTAGGKAVALAKGLAAAAVVVILALTATERFAGKNAGAAAASGQRIMRQPAPQPGAAPVVRMTAAQLLDKYAETQDKLRSLIVRSETSGRGSAAGYGEVTKGETHSFTERRFDGERHAYRTCMWGNVGMRRYIPRDRAPWAIRIWDGETFFQYDKGRTSSAEPYACRLHITNFKDNIEEGRRLHSGKGNVQLSGYFSGDDDKRVDEVLRKARRIAVRPKTERIGGADCYVIDSVSEYGRHTLWLDPARGYNLAKAVVRKGKGDRMGNRGVLDARGSYYCVLDNVRFEQIDGIWVPMEADLQRDEVWNPRFYCKGKSHVKRTEVIVNPDHDALGSFDPFNYVDDRALVPMHASDKVGRRHFPCGPQYMWLRGAKTVYDDKGRRVPYQPGKGLYPIVRCLPDNLQRRFDLTLPGPNEMKGRLLLICLCDMTQPASQQLALALRDRAPRLERAGVLAALVHASASGFGEAGIWARTNRVTFPIGQFWGGLPKHMALIRRAWGAERLPWLVLAGPDRIVRAEGFPLEELDEKIESVKRETVGMAPGSDPRPDPVW